MASLLDAISLLRNQRMQHSDPYRPATVLLVLFLAAMTGASVTFAQASSLAKAKQLFAAGSYDQAAHLLESSIKAHPSDADAHLLLGQIYTMQSRRSDAIQQFTQAIELEPDSAIAYNTLGTALSRFAEFEKARTAFEKAIALDPGFAQAHINLAMALAQASDIPGATEQLQTAIRLGPTQPTAATAHYLLGKVYEDSNSPKAIEELTAAVKIEPGNQEAWLALGMLRSQADDEAAALTAFQHAVSCNPHDSESQFELGSEYLADGDSRQAVIHLELARQLINKPTLSMLYKLDRALREQGNIAEAQQIRAQAQALLMQDTQINQHYQEAQVLDHDGIDLESKGQIESALEKYRAALKLNPKQDGYRLNYALALCRLNRWQQGIAELTDIVQGDPGNIEARRALFIARDKAAHTAETQP